MKRVIGLIGFLTVACVVLASTPVSAQKFDNKDVDFVKEAAQGGMMEVRLGELAMTNAANQQVKDFGKRMVDDHGKANKELLSLANNRGLKLSTDLDSKHNDMINQLTKIKGPEF